MLAKSPETVAAFPTAVLKARAYINDMAHKDEVLKIMRDAKFDIPEEYAAAYKDENNSKYHTADGGFEPADMDKYIADSVKFKTIAPGTDWRDWTYLTPLWRAQKALGLPLRPAPSSLS